MNLWQKKWAWVFDKSQKLAIAEEQVNALYFPSKDVLFSENDKMKRGQELLFISDSTIEKGALRLKISFEDIEGPKSIIFSDFKTTDSTINGNNGASIPIHRIKKLKLIRQEN
jgi:uncharacterized protein (UPF0248 family)